MPVILALKRLRLKDEEFEENLGYIVNSRLACAPKTNNKTPKEQP
jgi:hypothetical protein